MKMVEVQTPEASLRQLLAYSIEQKASDLHLSANQSALLRIEGDLLTLAEFPVITADALERMVYAILDEKQKQLFTSCLELDFALQLPELGRFRVNVFQQLHGIAAVFRLVPLVLPTLEALGAPAVIKDVLKLSAGLVLVTGATGCGKSTTLAAMIEFINTHHRAHVLTIEDPIEFVYSNKNSLIHQRQVHRDTLSFDAALRSALREDPDVILVGELRDLETMRLALTAAETGHLVLATLHTPSAPRAISRMVDVFSASEKPVIRNLIAASLQAVIYQQLIKHPVGGRVAVFEIMLGTPAVSHLIREDKITQLYSVMQTSASLGMCTMEQALRELVNKNTALGSEMIKKITATT